MTGPPKKMPGWKLGLTVFGGMVGLAAFAGAAVVPFLDGLEKVPATDEDRRLVLTADDLALHLPGFIPDPNKETLEKSSSAIGSFEIEYEYDGGEDDRVRYLTSSLNRTTRLSEAKVAYLTAWTTTSLASNLMMEDVEVFEREGVFRWGDESHFGVVFARGSPVGNVFVARDGKTFFYLLLVGVYVDNGETFERLVGPTLAAIQHSSE